MWERRCTNKRSWAQFSELKCVNRGVPRRAHTFPLCLGSLLLTHTCTRRQHALISPCEHDEEKPVGKKEKEKKIESPFQRNVRCLENTLLRVSVAAMRSINVSSGDTATVRKGSQRGENRKGRVMSLPYQCLATAVPASCLAGLAGICGLTPVPSPFTAQHTHTNQLRTLGR